MAYFQIYPCFILFLIIACHGILMTEGRHLKTMKKEELEHIDDQKATKTHGGKTLNSEQQTLKKEGGFEVPSAGGVPTAGLPAIEKKPTFPPQASTRSRGFGNSEPESINDFRPTTPGNSPGAGHSFSEHGIDTQSEALGNASGIPSTAAKDNDFRPTVPSHSPGVGHSVHN